MNLSRNPILYLLLTLNIISIMPATNFTKLALASIFALAVSASSTEALLTNPVRTRISRDIKTPDPVPQAGIEEAISLMSSGRMYRYNVPNAQESTVSKCEVELAEYTGHKYCVALNSCGSAIMLMMKCAGLQPGDEVLSNAFTFGAVPSAIEHAGGKVRRSSERSHFYMDFIQPTITNGTLLLFLLDIL